MKLSPISPDKRGSALISVVIFGAVVSVCAGFAFRATMFQTRMADRSIDYMAAMAVAEAGAELAMVELNKDAAATPVAFTGWAGSSNKTLTHIVRDNQNQPVGETEVQVWDLGGEPKVLATGYIPSKANAKITRSVQLSTKNDTQPSPFGGFGIYAFKDIDLQGSVEFHGNTGSGGSINWTGNNAQIFGNAQAAGTIGRTNRVTGKAEANSAPTPPPDVPLPEFNTALPTSNNNNQIQVFNSSGARVNVPSTGNSKNAVAQGNHDTVMPAPGTYRLNNLQLSGTGDLKIVGTGTVNIYVEDLFDTGSQGKISVDDGVTLNIIAKKTFNLNGNSTAVIDGNASVNIVAKTFNLGGGSGLELAGNPKVTVWAEETFRMRGNADINMSAGSSAANLIIYAKNSIIFDMNGTPRVKGVLFAPTSVVDMGGNVKWWGAILAEKIEASGNNAIYTEQSLLQPTGGSGAYVTAWVERSPVTP